MADRKRGTISRIKTNPASGLIDWCSFRVEPMGRTWDVARPWPISLCFTDESRLGRLLVMGYLGVAREIENRSARGTFAGVVFSKNPRHAFASSTGLGLEFRWKEP